LLFAAVMKFSYEMGPLKPGAPRTSARPPVNSTSSMTSL
jgi:hypothetical protein